MAWWLDAGQDDSMAICIDREDDPRAIPHSPHVYHSISPYPTSSSFRPRLHDTPHHILTRRSAPSHVGTNVVPEAQKAGWSSFIKVRPVPPASCRLTLTMAPPRLAVAGQHDR